MENILWIDPGAKEQSTTICIAALETLLVMPSGQKCVTGIVMNWA